MASNLPTLAPFDAGSNPTEAWRHWKQDFQDYVEALKYANEPEKTKTALFRHVCGDELKKQYRSFNLNEEVTLKEILEEFDNYFKDYQNEIYASFKFLEMKQEKGEKFADYYSRLRCAVLDCNYGQLEDRMLRDKVIQGLLDKPLQERLIRETSKKAKTLQEVASECKAAEHSKAQATEMNENKISVDAIKRGKSAFTQMARNETRSESKNKTEKEFQCKSCGKLHAPRKCPAYGTKCKKCQGRNHWAKFCKRYYSCDSYGKYRNARRINVIEQETDDGGEIETVFLGELKKSLYTPDIDKSESVWLQNITINGYKVVFKLDTGAQVNVIPESIISNWRTKITINKCKQPVFDYSDNVVPIIGECYLDCKIKNAEKTLKFLVTTLHSYPILGLQACKELGLIRRLHQIKNSENDRGMVETPEQIIHEFADVFTGVGRLNRTVKIKLKENYVPHVAAPRKVPLALHNKVKEELQHMVDTGIITKVEEPTDWVSNMVIVNTPKKLRICLDPRPLNDAIQRPHYPIPSADSLITKLQGCKVFTILDAKNGFWQLPLDEKSSYLTTFTTPWGRYRFLVLPFGLNNAPEEFQRAMDEIFEDEPTVNPYFDDIALGSSSIAEHCKLLRQTLARARKANLKFNLNKTQLALSSVSYLGHIMSDKGIEPDPEKVRAIHAFAIPKCREDLQRFLGMITYLAKFTPHLSNLTHSLRQLLKQNTAWLWDQNTQRDFELIKSTIAQAPCLQYFDDNKPVTVSVDASSKGLGVVLLQDNKPVAYGSVSLTETQQRYAQIEKELLAVIYGLEHFNYYTYGRPVVVQTDHKPLIGLSKKYYDTISPRLQRMLLRFNRYDASLIYVPGKQLLIADALSRAQLPNDIFEDYIEQDINVKVCLLTQATPTKWQEYATLTSNDEELKDVLYHIKNGWPDKSSTRNAAKAYWHCRDELFCTKDGIICRGQRLVVPSTARRDILKILHVSHKGIVGCKSKAREYFYWPAICKDVEEYIGKCKICQKYQRSNQKDIIMDQDPPDRPWKKIACDFFQLKGRQYLLMIDYFSKYVELQHMNSTTAPAVITAMKSVFARHGIPEELVSDGGPPFDSQAVEKFFAEWNVSHYITSPHFARSNGQVERAVQTIKNSLTKAAEDGKDLYMVLMDYRIQPSRDLPSPSELLMGRRIRSLLPSHPDLLKPKFSIQKAKMALKERQLLQHKYGNQHATRLPKLETNSKVWFRCKMNEPWVQGKIIQVGPHSRSYIIERKDGRKYRRNRFHVRGDKSSDEDRSITRTVEDFCNSNSADVNQQDDDNVNFNINNQVSKSVRKSNRTIVKPIRFRT